MDHQEHNNQNANPSPDSSDQQAEGFPHALTAHEARVLGCLVEKQATTPDVYPLTLNALNTACNQKSSRDPVMNLSSGEVGHTLRQLEQRKLVTVDTGSRASRYQHKFSTVYSLTKAQQALLAVLMLRGAQTAGELMTRTERIFKFDDMALLQDTLDRLARIEPAMVENIGRANGQREDRYMHRLMGQKAIDEAKAQLGSTSTSSHATTSVKHNELLERIEALEAQVAELAAKMQS